MSTTKNNSTNYQHQQPSICIPRAFANTSEFRVRRAIDNLSVARIAKIDIISRTNDKGEVYKRIFVHFAEWFTTDHAKRFRNDLLNGKELNVMYDNPWYWKVAAVKSSPPKLGLNKDNEDKKNVESAVDFMKKLTISSSASQEDNRPYRERRIDPIYVAQDMAQGFLERRRRSRFTSIVIPVPTCFIVPTFTIAPCLPDFVEPSLRRRDMEETMTYECERVRLQMVEDNRRRQEEEEAEWDRKEAEVWEAMIADEEVEETRRVEERIIEAFHQRRVETSLWEEKLQKIHETKMKEEAKRIEDAKKAKMESRFAVNQKKQADYSERYLAEKALYEQRNNEMSAYIREIKRDPDSARNFAIPNAQVARDLNEDFSEEFKGYYDETEDHTISFGDKPMPHPSTLKRARRQIVVE